MAALRHQRSGSARPRTLGSAARLPRCSASRGATTPSPASATESYQAFAPEERTTPASRFVVALDHNLHGKEMLWVDCDAGISMHPVITSNPQEHRAERLATPTPDDRRISYGCINVPPEFFKNIIGPSFRRTNGVVYVLPEIRSARQVFGW